MKIHDISKSNLKIILGSSSYGRKKVLEDAGYDFYTLKPALDEKAIRDSDPRKLTLLLAHAKADVLLSRIHEPALLVTSDQVVYSNGKILEKPETPREARSFLESYAIHSAEAMTAVTVTNTQTKKRVQGIDIVHVSFRPIPSKAIDAMIAEGGVYNWAGGFAVQHPLFAPYVKEVLGTVDSLMGLPLQLTEKLMKEVS